MSAAYRMRQYQQQAVISASPEQLVGKLYDLALAACGRGDRVKLRAVLVQLVNGLDFEQGGDMAPRLYALYEYGIRESGNGDLTMLAELLTGLRDAWQQGVLAQRPVAV